MNKDDYSGYSKVVVGHRGDIPCVIELPLSKTNRARLVGGIALIIGLSLLIYFILIPSILAAFYSNYLQSRTVEGIFGGWVMTIFGIVQGISLIRKGRKPSNRFQSLKGIKFYDKEVYMEWRRMHSRDTVKKIPKVFRSQGSKFWTQLPKDHILRVEARRWAKYKLDVTNKLALEALWLYHPFIRIEPDRIVWLRKKGKPEEIEKAREVLVSIAAGIERG